MTDSTPEREPDVLNAVTAACDGDAQHHPNPDPAYWRKHLKITVQPYGRQLVW